MSILEACTHLRRVRTTCPSRHLFFASKSATITLTGVRPAYYMTLVCPRSGSYWQPLLYRSLQPIAKLRLRATFQRQDPCNQFFTRESYSTIKKSQEDTAKELREKITVSGDREKILTIPNILTMARILASPYIGYLVAQQNYALALGGCVVFGLTDALDGYIARKYNMQSFVGSIIDPAADKVLMTVLTLSLAYGGLMPTTLAVIIIGRDAALSLAAFFIRWATLPEPKTLKRYFDISIPSVEVRPTKISKWNTALQLLLMTASLTSPVIGIPSDHIALLSLQWLTGATTIISGVGYITSKDTVHRLTKAEVAKRIPKTPALPKKH